MLLFILLFSISLYANEPPRVDKIILNVFKKAFPQASSVDWEKDGALWVACFKDQDKMNILYFNHEAEVVKSRRYYQEDGLPAFILARLLKRYEGKTIHGVTEITVGGRVTYSIIMQDAKKWYQIDANCDGVMQQVKSFRKA